MHNIYIIYKITNKINQKFYIGIHKTNDINDGYYGSGNYIKYAIKKYGIENFEKSILHVFKRRRDAVNKEREIVNEELLQNPLCYNLTLGGYGGFHHIRQQNKHKSCAARKIIHNKLLNKTAKVTIDVLQKYIDEGWELGFLPESRQKMSLAGKKRIQSEEHRKKNSESKKGCYLLENLATKKRKYVKRELVNEYLKNNEWFIYDIHRIKKGVIRIYNIKTNKHKFINPLSVQEYIENGWKLGVSPATKKKMSKLE